MKFLPAPAKAWEQRPRETAALIFPKFDGELRQPQLVRLQPMEALQRLLADRIWLGYPKRARNVARFLRWLAEVPSYALSYGGFDGVEEQVRKAMAHG